MGPSEGPVPVLGAEHWGRAVAVEGRSAGGRVSGRVAGGRAGDGWTGGRWKGVDPDAPAGLTGRRWGRRSGQPRCGSDGRKQR